MRWGNFFGSFLALLLISALLSCASKEKQAEEHFKQGFTCQNQGNLDRALAEYEKAVQLNPGLTKAYTNAGAIHLQREEYDRAIEQFQKVIQRSQWDTKAHYNLGFAYLKKGEVEKAKEEVTFLRSLRSELGDALEKKIEER
jgi:tetratricopeptide (TPR) repeat protein